MGYILLPMEMDMDPKKGITVEQVTAENHALEAIYRQSNRRSQNSSGHYWRRIGSPVLWNGTCPMALAD